MALASLNLNPSDRNLRQFGGICVVAVPLVAWLWTRDTSVAAWCAAGGVAVGAAAWLKPVLVKPLFVGLTIATFPIGLVVGELAMLLIYFGAFLPMSIVFRLIGRDTLQRRQSSSGDSLWQTREKPPSIKRYYQQF